MKSTSTNHNHTNNGNNNNSQKKLSPSSTSTRSRFYVFDRRSAVITGRVVGLNLQGHAAQPKKAFFSFVLPMSKEVKMTVFVLELSIAGVRWMVSKSFEELKQFHQLLHGDESLGKGRELLSIPFPPGEDGEDDVMLLVERREQIEMFFQQVLQLVDPELYPPLALFLDSPPHFDYVRKQLKKVAKLMRLAPNKKKLLLRLFEFYSKDLMDFVCKLENGIEVYNIDDRFAGDSYDNHGAPKKTSVLWLDVCEEPGLSRLCLAPKEIFALPAGDIYEDARLANGIFLSDIAEVRKGATCEAFRRQSLYNYHYLEPFFDISNIGNSNKEWYDATQCVSVVASERTLAFELIFNENEMATDLNTLKNAGFTNNNGSNHVNINVNNSKRSSKKRLSVSPAAAIPNTPVLYRLHFIEMLNLLSLQSLSSEDLTQRRRRFQKLRVCADTQLSSFSPLASPNFIATHKIDIKQLSQDATQTEALLLRGIEVEEEVVSPEFGMQIVQKMMRFDQKRRCLWITSLRHHEDVHRKQLEEEFDMFHPPRELQTTHSHDFDDDDEDDWSENEKEDKNKENGGYEDDSEEIATSSLDDSNKQKREKKLRKHRQVRAKEENGFSKNDNQDKVELFNGAVNNNAIHSFVPQTQVSYHHHQWQLTSSESRFLHIDDISEIRPGRVSSYVDHPEQDACVLSIIGSATIVVLPVPSLSLRDKLVRRFQHFVLKNRRFDELWSNDTPVFFQPRHFPKRQLQLWREQQQQQQKQQEGLELETEEDTGVLDRISEGEREHSDCTLLERDHAAEKQFNSADADDRGQRSAVNDREQSLKKHHLLSSRTAALSSFPAASRFSDTHLHQPPKSPNPTQTLSPEDMATWLLLGHSPRGTQQLPAAQGRVSAARRHSYDPQSPLAAATSNSNPSSSYVSPVSANTNTFQTSPLVGRTSSSSNGIFSHGRLARSVSTVRRSSSSTKGKNSLSEAFSFS